MDAPEHAGAPPTAWAMPFDGAILGVAAVVLVLAIGLLVVALVRARRRRLRGPRDVQTVTAVPVIGSIPADRELADDPVVATPGSAGRVAEAFRLLRAHVDRLRVRDGRTGFVVTAAGHGQGATTVAANLAAAIAGTGARVVVLDADLRRAELTRIFDADGLPGLTEVLAGRVVLDAALREGAMDGLTVLPAGARPANPGELLASGGMRAVLEELRGRFDAIVIDTPPITEVADAAVLGSVDGAALLVLARGATRRPGLEEALARLTTAGRPAAGIVLTGAPRRARRSIDDGDAGAAVFVPAPVSFDAEEVPAADEPAAAPAGPEPEATAGLERAPESAGAVEAAPVPAVPEPPALGPVPPLGASEERAAHLAPPLPEPTLALVPAPEVALAAPSASAEADPDPVTEVEHTIGTARRLDAAFAALPPAQDGDRMAELIAEVRDDDTRGAVQRFVERPVVVRPTPIRPSRFAPDPAALATLPPATPARRNAYASAPPPQLGTENTLPPAPTRGTVVSTVSIRVRRDETEGPVAPPPIRHILPRPTSSTIPPAELPPAGPPAQVEARPEPRTEPVAVAGSLLGEIGGLPRVEVRTAPVASATDTAPNPERLAREAYETRARELERVAHERLRREQQRIELSIREQLAHDKRELEQVLDNRLEDTVLHPRG